MVSPIRSPNWTIPTAPDGTVDKRGANTEFVANAISSALQMFSSWTPVLSFATSGDLAVTYGTQSGEYNKIGGIVVAYFSVITSAFTYTTSSGNLQIRGLPFQPRAGGIYRGTTVWGGLTLPSNTIPIATADTGSNVTFRLASTAAVVTMSSSNAPTGSTVDIRATVIYPTTA